MWCCHDADSQSRAHREGVSITQKAFCCHTLWDYPARISHWASIRPQHDSKTSHRVRIITVQGVTVQVSGWGAFVCLAGTRVADCSRTERKSQRQISESVFTGRMCVRWCCSTVVYCSLHPLVDNQSVAGANTGAFDLITASFPLKRLTNICSDLL